jgi:hypothetical protein
MHTGGSSLRQLAFSATLHCLTGVTAFPVNYRLIGRGRGHAAVHQHHSHNGHD